MRGGGSCVAAAETLTQEEADSRDTRGREARLQRWCMHTCAQKGPFALVSDQNEGPQDFSAAVSWGSVFPWSV